MAREESRGRSYRVVSWVRTVSLFSVLLALVMGSPVSAAPIYWSTTSYLDWNTPSVWKPGNHVPYSTDYAILGHGSYAASRTRYASSGTRSCNRLYLGYTTNANGIINQSNGRLIPVTSYIGYKGKGTYTVSRGYFEVSGSEYIGYDGSKAVGLINIGTQGTHKVASTMFLGYGKDTSGAVSQRGALETGGQVVGYSGKGTFIHHSGTNTVKTKGLAMGYRTGSEGTYTMNGATPTTSTLDVQRGGMVVGAESNADFNHNGGTVNIEDTLVIGRGTGGNGAYVMDGLTRLYADGLTIGDRGRGALTLSDSGARADIDGPTVVGLNKGASGTCRVNAGQFIARGETTFGQGGSGTLILANSAARAYFYDNVRLGGATGGIGRMYLNAGMLYLAPSKEMIVGDAASGTVTQTIASVQMNGILKLGGTPTGIGTYDMRHSSAQLAGDGDLSVGFEGKGTFNHGAGTLDLRHLTVGGEDGSDGTYNLNAAYGTAAAKLRLTTVGNKGVGYMNVSGGANQSTHTTDTLRIGGFGNGKGTYTLGNNGKTFAYVTQVGYGAQGKFTLKGGKHEVGKTLEIGSTAGGDGTYYMTPGGQLTDGAANATLIVRRHADASGTFQGTGRVDLSGKLINNGKVVASGKGILDMGTMASVDNTIENTTDNGWYAVNGAALALPTIPVGTGSGTYNWGESPGDATIDLVNSLSFDFDNVTAAGALDVRLLALDHASLPLGLENCIGAWEISALDGLGFDSLDLTFRYDDAMAGVLDLDPYSLCAVHYDGLVWTDVTTGLDTANCLVTAGDLTSFSYFALIGDEYQQAPPGPGYVIPEPATAMLLGAALAALGSAICRRRKRAA